MSDLPLRVRADVKRILDGAARRLLNERVSGDAELERGRECVACGQPAWAGSSTYGWFCRDHYQQETWN